MKSKAQKAATNKKTGSTAVDQELLEQAAREDSEGTGEAAAEARPPLVTLPLADICRVIGHDVRPEHFAATALTDLAGQVTALADLAERTEFSGYEAWSFTQNLAHRMRLAGRVAAWLDKDCVGDVPAEVAP